MTEFEKLRSIIEDLIEVARLQAEAMQQLATHLERQTTHMASPNQIPLILSELNELHQRIRKHETAGSADG